jgi:hypothetical protein
MTMEKREFLNQIESLTAQANYLPVVYCLKVNHVAPSRTRAFGGSTSAFDSSIA